MKGTEIYEEQRSAFDFVEFMAAGATSKTIATCVAYPHGKSYFISDIKKCKYRRLIKKSTVAVPKIPFHYFLQQDSSLKLSEKYYLR